VVYRSQVSDMTISSTRKKSGGKKGRTKNNKYNSCSRYQIALCNHPSRYFISPFVGLEAEPPRSSRNFDNCQTKKLIRRAAAFGKRKYLDKGETISTRCLSSVWTPFGHVPLNVAGCDLSTRRRNVRMTILRLA